MILISGETYGDAVQPMPDPIMSYLPMSYLDCFRASHRSLELCHLAIRIEKELFESGFNNDMPIDARDDLHVAGDWTLEQVTRDLVLLNGQVLPESTWKEAYLIAGVLEEVQGLGKPDLELSVLSWQYLEDWLTTETTAEEALSALAPLGL